MGKPSRLITFVVMGMTSMLIQITVLRLLLSTFSGNELDIGITLSFWLIYVALGSFTGRKLKFKHAFVLSFILVAIFSQPTALAIKAIRPALSLEPGEVVSLMSTILSTSVCLFPICFLIGIQFPLAVSYSGGDNAAGRVYGLEALGAFIGGLVFTFVISSRIGAMELCLLVALVNIIIAGYISKGKVIFIILIIPLLFYFGFYKIASVLPWQGIKPSHTVESKYGEIDVIKVREQSSIYANGQLLFSYPDVPTIELRTHLPMTLHPLPLRLLVIGGSPGILKEILKYPVKCIDFIELDPKVVNISLGLLSKEDRGVVVDSRVRIIIDDGRRFIKTTRGMTYDMIMLNLPGPSTANLNRFYTTDFFEETKNMLKKNGILVLAIPQSTGYIGKSMQTASGSVYNSLKSAFRHVKVTSQEYGGLFASEAPIDADPEKLEDRFAKRKITTKHFNQYIFLDAFSPFGVDYVRNRLSKIKIINTDLQPSAYLYNLILWSEIHEGRALKYLLKIKGWHVISISGFIILSISFLIFRRKKGVIYYSVFTTGFSGMSFTIAVLLVYQSLYGYIYEMFGVLAATFMIGLWSGASMSRYVKRALKMLFYLEMMTIILALTAPVFFRSEILFYLLIFLSGIITGGQFSTANISMGEPGTGGKLYGLDLMGSFLGALIPSIIFMPLFGVYNTFLFIAGIKTVSALMILSLKGVFVKA